MLSVDERCACPMLTFWLRVSVKGRAAQQLFAAFDYFFKDMRWRRLTIRHYVSVKDIGVATKDLARIDYLGAAVSNGASIDNSQAFVSLVLCRVGE